MALIKCPECGKEISDQATSCPNCGYPISNEKKEERVVDVTPVPVPEQTTYQRETTTQQPKKKGNMILPIAGLVALVVVVIAAVFIVNAQSTKAAEQLVDDLQGEWWTPYESIARTLDVNGDEMILSAETGFGFLDETADSYTFSLKPKDGETIEASSYGNNYEEYTITFNEDKTEFTVTPAILLDEKESETWFLGTPEFEYNTNESSDNEDSEYVIEYDDNEIPLNINVGEYNHFDVEFDSASGYNDNINIRFYVSAEPPNDKNWLEYDVIFYDKNGDELMTEDGREYFEDDSPFNTEGSQRIVISLWSVDYASEIGSCEVELNMM